MAADTEGLGKSVHTWFLILSGFTTGFAIMNLPPAADQFMELFGVGHAGLSLFLSGLLWTHAVMQIPAGIVSDRHPPHHIILPAGVVLVLANLVPFLDPANLTLAIACRMAAGVCTALCFLATLKLIAILVPAAKYARAQGIYGAAAGFGTMAPYLMPSLFPDSAWRSAYIALAVLSLAIVLGLPALPLERLRNRPGSGGNAGVPVRQRLATVFRCPDIWILGMIHGVCYGTLSNIGQWLPSILADLSNTSINAWALSTMLALGLGSAGRFASGHLTRFLSPATTVLGSTALVAVVYALLGLAESVHAALALGLVLAVVSGLNYGPVFSLGGAALPPEYSGVGFGLLSSLANLTFVMLTLLYGMVKSWTASFSWAQLAAGGMTALVFALVRRRVAGMDPGAAVETPS